MLHGIGLNGQDSFINLLIKIVSIKIVSIEIVSIEIVSIEIVTL